MKINKSLAFFPFLVLICLICASCTRAERVDYSELNRRLKRENTAYEFNEKEMLIKESVYYAFYSVLTENDMLLTMTEDNECRLTSVTLTASGDDPSEKFCSAFIALAVALTDAFVPPENAKELKNAMNTYADILYSECFRKTESGRYTAELFSDPIGVSVIISME